MKQPVSWLVLKVGLSWPFLWLLGAAFLKVGMVDEIWKDVKGYEGYYKVSNLGRIKSLSRYVKHYAGGCKLLKERILADKIDSQGYSICVLCKNGTKRSYKTHRLVAKAFILNPFNKPHINHKDGIKCNNSIENIEWCTRSENMRHALKTGLLQPIKGKDHWSFGKRNYKTSKKLIDTKTGKIYNSIIDASNFLGIRYLYLQQMVSGQHPNQTSLKYLNNDKKRGH